MMVMPDAQFQRSGISAEGRLVMARTELDEERLRTFLHLMPPAERRAFWLGALVRDGAVSVADLLRAKQLPKMAPARPRCVSCGDLLPSYSGTGRPRRRCDKCRRKPA